jgi:hypothetical protein
VHSVLKTDAAVAIARIVQARQHEQLDLFVATDLRNNLRLQGVERAGQDRANYCGQRQDLVADRI